MMTGAIMTESMSTDVQVFQGIAMGFLTMSAMPAKPKAPVPGANDVRGPHNYLAVKNGPLYLADSEGVLANLTNNRWYSRWIRGGTQLILSRGPVTQGGLLNAIRRFGRTGRRLTILSGPHGDETGRMLTQTADDLDPNIGGQRHFLNADINVIGRNGHAPGVRVLNAELLSDMQLKTVLTSGDDVYAAWCHSGVCAQLSRAFDRLSQ
ncbi:hypothetical protein D3C87_1360970 [compost metagenome]